MHGVFKIEDHDVFALSERESIASGGRVNFARTAEVEQNAPEMPFVSPLV